LAVVQGVGFEPTANLGSQFGRVLNVLLHLRKLGRREVTLKGIGKKLRYLAKHCDLGDPEAVKEFIVRAEWSSNYKGNVVEAYNHYVKFHGLAWERPVYQREERRTRIPTLENINKIISHSKSKGALAYSIIRDVGMRPIEVARLKVKDVDATGVVYPTTAKGGAGRTLKLPASTLAMWNKYVGDQGLGLEDRVFSSKKHQEPWKIAELLEGNWARLRNSVAEKLQQPELKLIRLYDLRHFYATMLYHKTKDILLVKQKLGHRRIENTLIYTHLVCFAEDEWICKAAETVEEAQGLIEAGFQYVTDMDGVKLFRKRK